MKTTKLPGYPNIIIRYAPAKGLQVPVFLLRNRREKALHTEWFNRYYNLHHCLPHYTLLLSQPYDGQDHFGQPYFSAAAIEKLHHVARAESLRLMSLVTLAISPQQQMHYFNGTLLSELPTLYAIYCSNGQSEAEAREAFAFFKFDYANPRIRGSAFNREFDFLPVCKKQLWKEHGHELHQKKE